MFGNPAHRRMFSSSRGAKLNELKREGGRVRKEGEREGGGRGKEGGSER